MSLDHTRGILEHDKSREMEAMHRKTSSVHGHVEGGWLNRMPFAAVGMTDPRTSLRAIFDFTVSATALDPAPGDLVLDLGAGSCWVSEWLNRLLVQTVSLDISHEMLSIGRQRLEPGARFTAGDFEALPFADGSFDGAICLSALHHVPNIPRAVREIRRVLKDDGVAIFSEPGQGHANHPQSRSEREELGVMERDIVATELLDECLAAGFRHVSVSPFLHPAPIYDYSTWRAIEDVRLPLPLQIPHIARQVASGISRGRLAATGSGTAWLRAAAAAVKRRFLRRQASPSPVRPKESSASHESAMLGWKSLAWLRQATQLHPIIIARKGWRQPDSRRPSILKAEIAVQEAPRQVTAGASFEVRTSIKNTGDTLWRSQPTSLGGFVALGAKLVDSKGLAVIYDYGRGILSRDMAPGESLPAEIRLVAPVEPGQYQVKLDMVDECVAWFEHHGSTVVAVPLNVVR